jgi:hypothetical protein
MIKIIKDTQNLMLGSEFIEIATISKYPDLYKTILDAVSKNQNLRIVVKSEVVYQWLKKNSSHYPQNTFHFETFDPKKALAEKWQVRLPEDLSNQEIIDYGLLELEINPQPGQRFEEIIMAHFFTPMLSSDAFPFTKLPDVLESINFDQWKSNLTSPFLLRMLEQQKQRWLASSRSSEQRQLITYFIADPLKLKRDFMGFRILKHYPDLGEAVLGSLFPLFQTLKLLLETLAVDAEQIHDTVNQVTYHLNAIEVESADDLLALIEGLSGLLKEEFEVIAHQLRTNPKWISHIVLDRLELKFESLTHVVLGDINAMRAMIPPPKPNVPDQSWDIDQMLEWATDKYLPYQAWCNQQMQFDSDIYQIGDNFSEWLVDNWHDLHANSKRMVFNILPNIANSLNIPEIVNLFLVVDNLGWTFSKILVSLFQDQGYFLTNAEPYLAMLPTETEISKKCLLAGEVGYSKINDKSYQGIIEKGWVPYFNQAKFQYLSDIGKLQSVKKIDAAVYLVNYLAVDKAMHQSSDEIGFSHQEHITHLLDKVVKNVMEFIERHKLQNRIRLHVVSDHGATKIPKNIQNDLDPAFFDQNGFEIKSHRYISVNNAKFAQLPDNLKFDCFFLPQNEHLLPENILCARRANRFRPTDQTIYVHGGLLPEEVIVPYLAFEPITMPVKELTILMKNNQFRYRLESIEFEIGNPNDVIVEQVQISVLNGNIESDIFTLPQIKGKTKLLVNLEARFKQTALMEDQNNLRLRIRYQCRGERYIQDFTTAITMRKMVEEKSTSLFDNLE